jgi:predicted RNase H-like nuclease (RuvC/YqgF family)
MKFDFYINKINEDKLRFILLNKNNNIFIEKYHGIYNLEQLKSINKYFKMFEMLNELQEDLLEIIKDNNIEIINVSKDEIIIILKVSLRNDNVIKLKLQKIRIDDRDKINFLLEEFKELKQSSEIKDKKIVELENNISIITKEMNEKNKRIESLENNLIKQYNKIKDEIIIQLENKIATISKELDNKNKRIDSLENNLNEFKKVFNISKEEMNQKIVASSKFGYILKDSNIFKADDEIELLLSNIPFKANNLKLLYDSKIDGENEEKLLNTYTGNNDLIVLVKTIKNKRFGGYAHECFEKNNFRKNDIRAFLFNLDKREIYKSNNKINFLLMHLRS